MCIPIDLNVPVLTLDDVELGTAREILCSCGQGDGSETISSMHAGASDDLWLRATRPLRPDLFIPFADITETRSDGVFLRLLASEAERRAWDVAPGELPATRAMAV